MLLGNSMHTCRSLIAHAHRHTDLQADVGPKATEQACRGCFAWGRDTCSSILSTTGIASWGGILMAPLFAVVVSLSLLLSQRIAAQKQALSQIISECRQDVNLAYLSLQECGKIQGISPEDLVSALATMWDTNNEETQVRPADTGTLVAVTPGIFGIL